MLHRRIALCAILSGLTLAALSPAANAAVDAAKLRQAVPLPSVSFSFGYQATNGLVIFNDEQDRAAQLAALKKSLTGGAEDAGRWQRLGNFYYAINDAAASKSAYAKALALYRTQTQKQPRNEPLLVEYGKTLTYSNAPKQAEIALRRAVQLAPRDADAWGALGRALMNQAFPALLTPEQQKEMPDLNVFGTSQEQAAPGGQFKDYKPAPEQVQQARQFLEEAQRCFDKAVLVQPQSPVGYLYRAEFRASGQVLQNVLVNGMLKENVPLAAAIQSFQTFFAHGAYSSPGALADTQQAAKTAPDDLPIVAGAAMTEFLAIAYQFNETRTAGQGLVWNTVASQQRQATEEDIIRLEHIAQTKDAAASAQAATAAGLIWMFADRQPNAERDLRLAVSRDPHDQSAWDGLLAVVLADKRYAESAALADKRLKTLDDAHTRLVLAKIDDKLEQPAEVQAQVQAALKDEPDDLTANLAQAVLLLRRSDDPAVLQQARQQMDRVGILYQKNQTQDNWKNYAVIVSVYDALTGGETEARQGLAQVLATDKDNQEAAQVLAALGPPDPAAPVTQKP